MTQGARPNPFFEPGPASPVFPPPAQVGWIAVARSLELPHGFQRYSAAISHAFHNSHPKHQPYRIEPFH